MLNLQHNGARGLMPLDIAQPEGWALAAPGALVHNPTRTAVIADLHLGYEWSRGRRGDVMPAHSLAETSAKLDRLLAVARINRLIVAGDMVESRTYCRKTEDDVSALAEWLHARGIALYRVRGNHDPSSRSDIPSTIVIDGWTICHGDDEPTHDRMIIGHHHPAIGIGGVVAPCFLISQCCIILPAFSQNAAGLNVLSRKLPRSLGGHRFHCVAVADEALLGFGELDTLRQRAKATV